MIYNADFSLDEKVIDLYQQGYSVPYIADAVGIKRRKVCIILGIII